jgi:hypothetical protein
MTQEHDGPEADEIRRLLADARHTEPVPGDVAARLDRVLADLAASRSQTPSSEAAPVVSLSAHRRRRAAGLLVAAAAIVVGGVAVAQQLPHGTSSSETTSGTAADRAPTTNGGDSGLPSNSPATQPQLGSKGALVRQGRIVVRPQHFSADALAGRRLVATKAPFAEHQDESSLCIAAPAHSLLLRAVYQHAPAVLVYHRAAGSTQVVDLFVCGSARPLKSVTLPTG